MDKDKIVNILNSLDGIHRINLATALIGEFNCRGRLGVYGVGFAFHSAAHTFFEHVGLQLCFELSMQLLKDSFTSLYNNDKDAPIYILSVSNLLQELLAWEFGEVQLYVVESKVQETVQLPLTWRALLDEQLIDSLFWVYTTCRTHAFNNEGGSWLLAHKASRGIILELGSFSGKVFHHHDKVAYVNALLKNLIAAFGSCFEGIDRSELRQQELQSMVDANYKTLLNFKLQVVAASAHFTSLIQALHGATLFVALEIEQSSQTLLNATLAGRPMTDTDDIFDDWRWQVLEVLLDAWAVLLTDPSMAHRGRGEGLLSGETRGLVLQSGSLFNGVMSGLLASILADSLAAVGLDALDEVEVVSAQRLEGLISSVCVLGRADVLVSLQTAAGVLESTVQELLQVSSQTQVSPLLSEQLLETLRVCVLLVTRLLADADDDAGAPVDLSPNSDAAAIPSAVLDALLCASPQGLPPPLSTTHALVMQTLQIQLRLAQSAAAHPLYSPVVVQACLRFVQLFVLVYVEPEPCMYAEDTSAALPGLFRLLGAYLTRFPTTSQYFVHPNVLCI